MALKVEIKCVGSAELPLKDLLEFQGNLKSLSKENYGKLKKEILELGFSEPFSVWKSPRGYLLLNGHQRARTLKAMAEEGFELPGKFPVSVVDAKDEAEAKRKVLAMASQYGTVEGQGLYEFMHEAGIAMDDLEGSFAFPEIDLDEFRSQFFEEGVAPEPAKRGDQQIKQITLFYDPETYETMIHSLNRLLKERDQDDYSTLVKALVDEAE
jgi:ParB-like nuclease family protein